MMKGRLFLQAPTMLCGRLKAPTMLCGRGTYWLQHFKLLLQAAYLKKYYNNSIANIMEHFIDLNFKSSIMLTTKLPSLRL